MTKRPVLWGMSDDEIIEELDRFAYWYDAVYATHEQRALAVIAEAVKRLLQIKKKKKMRLMLILCFFGVHYKWINNYGKGSVEKVCLICGSEKKK